MAKRTALTLLTAAACLLSLASLEAGGARIWNIETLRDFSAGEAEGVRLEADGGISAGPVRIELARLAEVTLLLSAIRTPTGDLYAGTGFDGAVYRITPGGRSEKIATLEEPAVFALAAGPKGEVYAAGSPGGRIYRVDPAALSGGKASLVAETHEKYVWSMAVEKTGCLLAATGDAGKLFRLRPSDPRSKPELLLDSTEPNLHSLALAFDGTIYCGTDGKALVYRVGGAKPAIVADSHRGEIASILPRSDGTVLILATSGETTLQVPPERAAKNAASGASTASAGSETPAGNVSVTVETSFGNATAPSGRAAFDLLRLRKDGVVETAATLEDEVGYSLLAVDDKTVWVSAGPKGRLYSLEGKNLALVRDLPEKNPVVLLSGGGGAVIAGTADGAALYRAGPGIEKKATYLSQIHAEERRSLWGAFYWQGVADRGRVRLSFRSGGSPQADDTWSDWVEVKGEEGTIPSPPDRYLQWRAVFETDEEAVPERGSAPRRSPFLRKIAIHAFPGNVAPALEQVNVFDPGVIFVRGSYGGGNIVVEAANPDERGMFTSVGEAKERLDLGKKMFRRGFRTLAWKATDVNEDPLLAEISFGACDDAGRPKGDWLVAAKDLSESMFGFDASVLPDGCYLFRVRVSDRKGNGAGEALEDEKVSPPVFIDNTPPIVEIESVTAMPKGFRVKAKTRDELSPILRAERSIDGGDWVPLRPVDGACDERMEEFDFVAEGVLAPPRLIVLRVLDSSFNVTTRSCLGSNFEHSEKKR